MKPLLYYLLLSFVIFSCGQADKTKTTKNDSESKGTSSSGENIISFKVDGDEVKTEGWIVQRFIWDSKNVAPWLNITSNMHKDKRTINVNLFGATPGQYNFVEDGPIMGSTHGSYFPDFSSPLTSYSFINGGVNITDVDTVKGVVNGTFMGTAKDGNGKTVMISEGKLINVKLKSGLTNLDAEMNKLQ